jgi:hypothetical protein
MVSYTSSQGQSTLLKSQMTFVDGLSSLSPLIPPLLAPEECFQALWETASLLTGVHFGRISRLAARLLAWEDTEGAIGLVDLLDHCRAFHDPRLRTGRLAMALETRQLPRLYDQKAGENTALLEAMV